MITSTFFEYCNKLQKILSFIADVVRLLLGYISLTQFERCSSLLNLTMSSFASISRLPNEATSKPVYIWEIWFYWEENIFDSVSARGQEEEEGWWQFKCLTRANKKNPYHRLLCLLHRLIHLRPKFRDKIRNICIKNGLQCYIIHTI